MTPGIYDIPAEEYHRDPAPDPSLSSSIAHRLLSQSALHAWHAHPRLNPRYVPQEAEAFDVGTAAHALILQGENVVEVIDAKDYKTKDAREKRDAARAAGKVPILAHRWADVEAMTRTLVDRLGALRVGEPGPFRKGKPEQTLIWQDGPPPIWCRARADWLHDDHRWIDDLKTTYGTANPDAWIRSHLFAQGLDVQAAFYLRGLQRITGKAPAQFRFVVIESAPPYGLSVVSLGPAALDLANRKVERAMQLWQHCLATKTWPGYQTETCYAEPLPWDLAKEESAGLLEWSAVERS